LDSCRRGSGVSSRFRSAPSSDSARSSGISCRRATRSSCSAASTRSTRVNTGGGLRRCRPCLRSARSSRRPCGTCRSASGCAAGASLIQSPRMLFLDEPTIGLDVSAKAMIRELLWTESRRERVTLLLTSHDTGDMERVCTRAIVINHGRLLWDGPIAALRRSYLKAKRVTLWSEAEHLELTLPGVRVLSSASYRTELEISLEITPLGQVVDAALRQAPIRDMAIEDAPLDEVIRALYATAELAPVTS